MNPGLVHSFSSLAKDDFQRIIKEDLCNSSFDTDMLQERDLENYEMQVCLASSLNSCKTFNQQLVWLEKREGSNLDFEIINVSTIPSQKYQVQFQLKNQYSDVGKVNYDISVYNNQTLVWQDNEAMHIFHRDLQSVVNIYSTCSSNYSSFMTMEIMTDDHWQRLKEILAFAQLYHKLPWIDYSTAKCPETLKTVNTLTFAEETCSKTITQLIESLNFFPYLGLEDQIIILKESFEPLAILLATHLYDRKNECFMVPAFGGKLTFCRSINKYLSYSIEYGLEMHEFQINLTNKFNDYLLKDIFIISILCILCILEDRPGLSCEYFFENERRLYLELLDIYIKGKLSSKDWPLDQYFVWENINFVTKEASRYKLLRRKLIMTANKH